MLGKIILGIIFLAIFLNLFSLAFASSISISEVMPHPSSGSDWVKITNNTTSSIDLTNWTLSDSTSAMKTLSGSIDPNQTLEEDVSNRLNNGGDAITLKDSSGTTIDSYSYNSDPGVDVTLMPGSPQPTPDPTANPTSNPTSNPSSSPSSTSNFQISSNTVSLDSTQILPISVTLNLSSKPDTQFYLKGAFYKDGSTNYFGLTQVNGSWIKNSDTYSDQLPITTDSSGNWSGTISVMVDPSDSGFTSSGTYSIKVARYTTSGDLTWSNSLSVNVSYTPTPSPSSSSSVKSTTSNTPKPSITSYTNSNSKSYPSLPSVEGTATSAAIPNLTINPPAFFSPDKTQSSSSVNLIVGIILIVLGLAAPIVYFLKDKLPFQLKPLRFLIKRT